MLTFTSKSVLLKLIGKQFGDYEETGHEIKVNCPWCVERGRNHPDTQRKLWINLDKGLYHCWRCEAGGSLRNLFPQLASEFKVSLEEKKPEKQIELEPLPANLVRLETLPANHLVHEYLAERQTTIDEIANVSFFCSDYQRQREDGYVHSFGPRIIFPIYQANEYRGFQGRTIWRNTEPKYVGALGMQKKKLIWNYDTAIRGSRIILTEGVFDAIRVGAEGCAIFGKAISPEQIRLLQLGNIRQVIVWLDTDARKDAEQTARRLALYFPSYMLVSNEFKDAGEVPKQMIPELVKNNVQRIY